MTRKAPVHLPAVLMLGFVSQIGQVVLLREFLMVFHGNELSIGIILAAWLAWVGVGSRLGVALVNWFNRPRFLLILSAADLLLALPATVLLIRGLRGFFDILPGAYLSLFDIIISCFLLMAPVCLLLGIQFVLLSRVWRENVQAEDTSGAGKTYIGEAAGNVLGGIIFTFLMVRYLNSLQAVVLAGMVMVLAILFMARAPGVSAEILSGRSRMMLWGLLVVTAFAYPFLGQIDDWAYRLHWRNFTPYHQLVETRQSKHGTIAVVQRKDQFSFFQSGHLVFSAAGLETVIPGFEEQDAVVLAHFSMVQHENPERTLLIGGGLRGTLREILRHPVTHIDYIELDEVLTEAALPFLPEVTLEALADPRVRMIHADGRLFVKTTNERYDMIIVDVPDPATAVLNRFYTREFFLEAEALLNPDGVFVIGVTSTPDLRGIAVANRNATIYHTLRSVFLRVLPVGDRFMFYFAANASGQVSSDVFTLQERYRERHITNDDFSVDHFYLLLEESQLRRVNWIVRNHGRAPGAHLSGPAHGPIFPDSVDEQERLERELPLVGSGYFLNSDFRPIGYYYTVMFWDDLTRNGRSEIFRWLLHVELWWILPFIVIPLLVVLGLRVITDRAGKRSDIHFAILFIVFSTGFSTMVLQIALLFSFQSVFGFVYEIVGLIVAIFMLGLALGALFTNRYLMARANINTLAGTQLLIVILSILIAVLLPAAAAVQFPSIVFVFFSALTFTAGLINGIGFPLSTACYMKLNGHAEKSAGIVYSVELSGACIGAALASVVVVPILGIIASCIFAGVINGTAFATILISRRS